MRLCFFGGTFDPPHLGHENLINELLLRFDKVIVMPSRQSPGKKYPPLIDGKIRFKMLTLCDFSNNSKCIISDYELNSEKEQNHTIDTIFYLKNRFKKYEIHMAIGLDQFNILNSWYKSDKLIKAIKIICFNRYGLKQKNKLSINCQFIEDFNYNISSSDIRNFILNDKAEVKEMINEKIFNYVIKKKFYK